MTAQTRAYVLGGLALLGSAAALASADQRPPVAARADAGIAVRLNLAPPASGPLTGGDTRCEKCHTTKEWKQATFDHDKTGFFLKGAHATANCKECHEVDFAKTLSRTCAGCHQDPHRGELGQQCQGCHTDQTWAPLFNADAHRGTNFPLVGRHAFIPCTECHTAMTNRSFERNTVDCLKCHQADYNATAAAPVNHFQLGFGTNCAECHTGAAWAGARFTAHDHCFQIVGGRHSDIACLSCHTTLAGASATGACNDLTPTLACNSCHEHACSRMDATHANAKVNGSAGVPGYACQNPKCYACHTIVSSP